MASVSGCYLVPANPSEYRRKLPQALALYRSGHTPRDIALALGGLTAWWETLIEAAQESPTDDTLNAVVDMRQAGHSVDRIALATNLSRREVTAAVNYALSLEPVEPIWDADFEKAVIADYSAGLTVPQLRRKYGYRTDRVAARAIRRMEQKWRI